MTLAFDDDELRVLVQLWLSHATRAAALASALLEHDSAHAVAALETFRPNPWVAREVPRVMAALTRARIYVVPVWEWPWHIARVQPLAPALLVRGNVALLWRQAVSIVGARRAHPSAEKWAHGLAAREARRGALIVSGGARGIDTAAHRGALDVGGETLAYLGIAADAIYPRNNQRLFARIMESGGALVSEHLPLTRTFKGAHALRNRFIAAQALQVYVAEADVNSGSLGTAAFAVRYGVPVRVAPPGIGLRRAGIDALMRGGAEVADVSPT